MSELKQTLFRKESPERLSSPEQLDQRKMPALKQTLFRKVSLERLSSPEQLDQLMQVVSPKDWLPLASLGFLLMGALTWGIFGRIPITVQGQGVIVYPRQVVPLQSNISGQLLDLNLKVGDVVKKGDVLGTVDPSEIRKQLQLERLRLTELQAQDQAVSSLQGQGNVQQEKAIQQQRQYLQQRLQQIQALTPVLKAKGNDSVQQQRQGFQQHLLKTQALIPVLKHRQELRKQLFEKERAVTSDVALEAEQQYLENLEKISDVKAQLKELDVKEAEEKRAYLENLSTITDLKAQLKALDSQKANLARQNLQDSITRQKEIQEVKRNIAQLELQLQNNSQIISQQSGRILEVTLAAGAVLTPGTRLANIAAEVPSSKLVGVTFFSVQDGKKIQPGMTIQITPQTVKRERFGGILGKSATVSAFPITREAAANLVGNTEVVEDLMPNEQSAIAVSADLVPSSTTFSGYKWSSSNGPKLKLSSGTTTTARVIVEERTPITFVLPILRELSGIY